ncbi:hypothetical protein [Mangrovitalea sediminis]|uniref:hypothetical protein n=1 Tax=Mangrovitalea sediminis TaxID=1982043 RepID=UPI000BE52FDA|nr:hypothetical protein [Mangrovitalea sediminis]
MEDWQGCLDPVCQNALIQAKTEVDRRGGAAISVEDFLLELLQVDKALVPFLSRCAVDQDELVRTIQCEQPLTTPPSESGGLCSQLVYWLSLARDLCDSPWLSVADLLKVMVYDADRLSHKAYVAVLEKVGEVNFRRYRDGMAEVKSSREVMTRPLCLRPLSLERPFLVAVQTDWIESARDLLVSIGRQSSGSIHCLWGEAGSGCSSLIRYAATLADAVPDGRLGRVAFLALDVEVLSRSNDLEGLLEAAADYLGHGGISTCLVMDPGCSAL